MTTDSAEVPLSSVPRGLTSEQARKLLLKWGPNAVREQQRHLLLLLLAKFWAPVPWMLEVTVALELVLGKRLEAMLIATLLVFNASLSLFQETRAHSALMLLQKRLAVATRVLRDGVWNLIPAEQLVPGDLVHLQLGDLVPADLELRDGHVLLDQSALTGESLPVEAEHGKPAYAGSLVRRGEANGEVIATGERTSFGKTAQLVRSAVTASHLQHIIFSIVKYLVTMDLVLAATVSIYALFARMSLADTLPFILILLVASVPVALPATFTLATALGALELAASGVLVTRLSAIEEAAAMDVLCSDKTGTITQNQLSLEVLRSYPPFTEQDLLRLAAYASDQAGQDPLDLAILVRARREGVRLEQIRRVKFTPFEPASKMTEAVVIQEGKEIRALKGAPQAIAARVGNSANLELEVEQLAGGGYRILAVAAGADNQLRLAGLLAFQDPPREQSKSVIASLNKLGVRVLMVTGDGVATARAVAAQIGITGRVCSSSELRERLDHSLDCAVFAGVFPEDKFRLVRALQEAQHVVGMTGDGVNDAPALKQAEVGIAVASATDVAKASASIVLVDPGLTGTLAAVQTSRCIYQRMLTYTLNKIIKTVQISLFLSLGLIFTRSFVITPLLIVLLLFANDFITMSIATDHVSPSPAPDRWDIRSLMIAGLSLGSLLLMLSFGLFFAGKDLLGLALPQLQTLVFLMLVFTGQGMIYLVRERRHFWLSAPSRWMLVGSLVDVAVVCAMAVAGVLMTPLPAMVIAGTLLTCALFVLALDFLKTPILTRLISAS